MVRRMTAEQTEVLRRQAEAEGRTMHAGALSAIDEYVARRQERQLVRSVLDRVIA